MAIYFFDTNAIVKRYVTEPGSAWVREQCDAKEPTTLKALHTIFISEITIVEGAAALAILVRNGVMAKRDGQDAYKKFMAEADTEYKLIGITSAMIRAAAQLTQQHPLKGYDALQLAVTLHIHQLLNARKLALTFVSSDKQLLRAAQAESLTTIDPTTVPIPTPP
jgi:predicted nucleic acid-binding protein